MNKNSAHALTAFTCALLAGTSPGSHARRVGVFKENITHFVHNEPMRNIVDKQKGY